MRIRLNNSGMGSKDIDPAGGTITAPLRLTGTPTNPLEAVSSSYVLNAASSFSGANVTGVFASARLPAYTGTELSSAGNGIFTLNNTGVVAGTYAKVIVNTKGRVTSGAVLVSADVPNLSYTKLIDKPTTLAGYGITDVVSLNGGVMTGVLNLNGTPTDSTHLVSKAYVDTRVAGSGASAFVIGDVVSKSSATTPTGFLRCNGGVISRTAYASLFSVIGTIYNRGTASNSGGKPWVMQYDFNTTQSENITGWIQDSTLNSLTATGGALAVYNSRIVIFGGNQNGSGSNSFTGSTAPLESDGTVLSGGYGGVSAFPEPVESGNVVIISNRLHYIGGVASGLISSRVYTRTLALTSWTTGTPLPGSTTNACVIVTSSRVYSLGGDGSNSASSVYVCAINADGTLDTWSTGTPLPINISKSHSIIIKNRVYLLGGRVNGNASSAVYTASINADGTLGTWGISAPLPVTVTDSSVVATRNTVYLLGGTINGTTSSAVYRAPVNADGSLGTWVIGTPLPVILSNSMAAVVNGKIYMFGGITNNSVNFSAYRATFVGGFNTYESYLANSTTASTDFTLPDTTLDDSLSFYSYIKL